MSSDPEVNGILEDIDIGIEMVDDIEVCHPHTWERGEDFLSDVRDKLRSVRATIEDRDFVTERQSNAVANWIEGIERWCPD